MINYRNHIKSRGDNYGLSKYKFNFFFLLIGVSFFYKNFIFSISIADLSAVIIMFLALIFLKPTNIILNYKLFLLIIIYFIFIFFQYLILSHSDIKFVNFIISYLRIIFYFSIIIFFYNLLNFFYNIKIKKFFKFFVKFSFFLNIYILINQYLYYFDYTHLPFEFIFFGQQKIDVNKGIIGLNIIDNYIIIKSRSFFFEPSMYANFLIFSYAIINYKSSNFPKINILIFISLFQTLSLTGFFAIFFIILFFIFKKTITIVKKLIYVFIFFFIFLNIYTHFTSTRTILDQLIFYRAYKVVKMDDGSALKRTLLSNSTVLKSLSFNIYHGTSLGSLDYFEAEPSMDSDGNLFIEKNYFHTFFHFILGSTGILGFIFFMILILRIFLISKEFSLAFFTLFITSGAAVEITFYIYLLIAYIMKKNFLHYKKINLLKGKKTF